MLRLSIAAVLQAAGAASTGCHVVFSEVVGGMIWGIAADVDGQVLVAPSLDHSIYLWNVSAGFARRRLDGHTDEVWRVGMLQGPAFVTASLDGTVRLWTFAADGGPSSRTVFAGRAMVTALASAGPAFAHGDKAGQVSLRRYGKDSVDQAGQWHLGDVMVQALAFAPDGSLLASTDDGMVYALDPSTQGHRRKWRANNGSTVSLAVRGDGMLVTSGYNRLGIQEPWALQQWCLDVGDLLSSSSQFGVVTALAFEQSSGHLLFGGFENSIFIVQLPTWTIKDTLRGHTDAVHALHVLADGRVLSGGADHSALLWRCMECSEYEAEFNRSTL